MYEYHLFFTPMIFSLWIKIDTWLPCTNILWNAIQIRWKVVPNFLWRCTLYRQSERMQKLPSLFTNEKITKMVTKTLTKKLIHDAEAYSVISMNVVVSKGQNTSSYISFLELVNPYLLDKKYYQFSCLYYFDL